MSLALVNTYEASRALRAVKMAARGRGEILFQNLTLQFDPDRITQSSIRGSVMASYKYAPLSGADEIRVLILEPSQNKTAILSGSLRKIRLPAYASPALNPNGHAITSYSEGWFQSSDLSSVSPEKTQWKWRFTNTTRTFYQRKTRKDGSKRVPKIFQHLFAGDLKRLTAP